MKAFVLKLEENLLNQNRKLVRPLEKPGFSDSNYTSLWTWVPQLTPEVRE